MFWGHFDGTIWIRVSQRVLGESIGVDIESSVEGQRVPSRDRQRVPPKEKVPRERWWWTITKLQATWPGEYWVRVPKSTGTWCGTAKNHSEEYWDVSSLVSSYVRVHWDRKSLTMIDSLVSSLAFDCFDFFGRLVWLDYGFVDAALLLRYPRSRLLLYCMLMI